MGTDYYVATNGSDVRNLTIDGFTVKGGSWDFYGSGIVCGCEQPNVVIQDNIIRENTGQFRV